MKLNKKLTTALLPFCILSSKPASYYLNVDAQARQTLEDRVAPKKIFKKFYPINLYNYTGKKIDQADIEVEVTSIKDAVNKLIVDVRTIDWKDESKEKRFDRPQMFSTLTRLDLIYSKNVQILSSKQEAYLINYKDGGKWNELVPPDKPEVLEAKKVLEDITDKIFEIIIPDVEIRGVEIPVREKTQDLLQKFSEKYWKDYHKNKDAVLKEISKEYETAKVPSYTLLAKGTIVEERLLKTLAQSFNHTTARRFEIPYIVKDNNQGYIEIFLEVGITSKNGEGSERKIRIPVSIIEDFENLRKETAEIIEVYDRRQSTLAAILENEKKLDKVVKNPTVTPQTTSASNSLTSASVFPFREGDKFYFDTYFTMPNATPFGIRGAQTLDVDDDAVLVVENKRQRGNLEDYTLRLYQSGNSRYNFEITVSPEDKGTIYFWSKEPGKYIRTIAAEDLANLKSGNVYPIEYDFGNSKGNFLGSLLKTSSKVRLEYDEYGPVYIEEILEGKGFLGIGSQRNTIKHYRTSFTQQGQIMRVKRDQDFLRDILKTLRVASRIKSIIDAFKK